MNRGFKRSSTGKYNQRQPFVQVLTGHAELPNAEGHEVSSIAGIKNTRLHVRALCAKKQMQAMVALSKPPRLRPLLFTIQNLLQSQRTLSDSMQFTDEIHWR